MVKANRVYYVLRGFLPTWLAILFDFISGVIDEPSLNVQTLHRSDIEMQK